MSEMDLDKEIELINEIISQAVSHGGDAGGAYCTNAEFLNEAIIDWLNMRGLDDKYTTTYEIKNDRWDIIAIVKK